jgi:hypothetical protein
MMWRNFVAALLLTLGAVSAWADVGFVKTVGGDATIVSAGASRKAEVGAALKVGDELRTAAGASMGITLRDNTVMSFGPSTVFVLEEYLFAPSRGEAKLTGRIGSGSLHYISGLIARNRPDAVAVKTPTGTIGVRGTRFVVVVDQ